MDRRPERAFATKRLTENLLKNPELEISLVHFKKMSDEPLYKRVNEIIIPLLSLPWGSHFFSFIWFCLKTKEKFDIVHWPSPYVYPFFWLFPAKKVVVMTHGGYIGIWTLPNTIFYLTLRFFNKNVAFVGVSKWAKEEIMDTYRLPESKVYVTYNGVDPVYRYFSDISAKEILRKYNVYVSKYFFYVGSMHPHKNVNRLIEAYILLRDSFPDIEEKLLIVGKTSYGDEVLKMIKNTKYSQDIINIGFVPLEDLPAFYSNATALVYASLNEGFGMPIVEAMACGTPVITSNLSAMPEIAGEAALLVDPKRSEEIMKGMLRMARDESLRKDLIEKGYKRASLFTWERFAKENLEVYKKVLNSN